MNGNASITSVKTPIAGVLLVASLLLGVLGLIEISSLINFRSHLSYNEGIAFSRMYWTAIAALLGAAFCAISGIKLRRNTRSLFVQLATTASIGMAILGIAFLCIASGNMATHSVRSPLNECINNVRDLEKAKQAWAVRTGATNGTPVNREQIASEFPNGFPVCPDGGRYNLGKVGQPVTCSISSHQIAEQ
jgi:hypothetical protein